MIEPVVILGMHKSGTTLIAKTLHSSGIEMIDYKSDLEYDAGNQYERISTNKLNKMLLKCGNKNSSSVFKLLDPNTVAQSEKNETAELFKNLFQNGSAWGFKDPRTCLTYAYLKQFLGSHKVIGVIRNPMEVHAHYTRNHKKRLMFGVNSLRSWHAYNLAVLEAVKANPTQSILIDYSTFMKEQSEFDRLQNFLDVDLVDMRRKDMYRSEATRTKRYKFEHKILERLFKENVSELHSHLLAFHKLQIEKNR